MAPLYVSTMIMYILPVLHNELFSKIPLYSSQAPQNVALKDKLLDKLEQIYLIFFALLQPVSTLLYIRVSSHT
jgi:hypothetical protein